MLTTVGSSSKIGMVQAFVGHYLSSKLIKQFLEEVGFEVVSTDITHRDAIDVGTTTASADLCLPIRTFVGHAYKLLKEHPGLDYIVVPAIHSEDGECSACAKYRDVAGVVKRSLSDTLTYLLHHSKKGRESAVKYLGKEYMQNLGVRGQGIPILLMPEVHSLDEVSMKNVCLRLYMDIKRRAPVYKGILLLPKWLRKRLFREIYQVERAFGKVYLSMLALMKGQSESLERKLLKKDAPRLGLVGRRYLLEDPALSCDIKNWFQRQGVQVFTPRDLPREIQDQHNQDFKGFYAAHREGQAFIHWAHDKLDGCICIGSFGCHPDGFQVDYLAEYARELSLPCWTFRYDENTGNTGFITRYETILSFLRQKRALNNKESQTNQITEKKIPDQPNTDKTEPTPIIIWPYMGEILNLVLQEAAYQLGLDGYILPPDQIDEKVIYKGGDRYTQTCSPYACTTGSLKSTIEKLLDSKDVVISFNKKSPKRIIMMMVKGEGPCTLGWYSIAQNKHIPQEYAERLKEAGYSLEMLTMGLEKNNSLKELFALSTSKRGRLINQFLKQKGYGLRKKLLFFCIVLLGIPAAVRVLAKLKCLEGLRAHSLLIRAHERKIGSVKETYQQAINLVAAEHSLLGILRSYRQGLRILKQVPKDKRLLPRVVVVGEIYVMLTSFANRGTTETLLPRAGVEVVEGITLSGYIQGCLQEIFRRTLCNLPVIRAGLNWIRSRGITIFEQRTRDLWATPFFNREVGGEGLPSVGRAQYYVLKGCDGIVHMYPFKCMPEAISDDALRELARFYGVRYLSLTYDKEVEIERLKTEVNTFGVLLQAHMEHQMKEGIKTKNKVIKKRIKAYNMLQGIPD